MDAKKPIQSLLLIDDDEATNFLHQIVVKESGCVEQVHIATDGEMALNYLALAINGQYLKPNLILLDINMPVLDGWGFLEAYHNFAAACKADTILIVLSASLNPADEIKALAYPEVSAFKGKPLRAELMQQIAATYFGH